MRRFPLSLVAAIALVALLCSTALADGLYKGHGRRSHPPLGNPWSLRLNASGGLHSLIQDTDEFYEEPGLDRFDYGSYLSGGLELYTGNGVSMEFSGSYRPSEDEDRFWVYPFSGPPVYVNNYRDVEAWSVGLTLRKYQHMRHSQAWFGFGGGYINSQAEILETEFLQTGGEQTSWYGEFEDEAGEIHFMVGYDWLWSSAWSVGVEAGYRHTWLEDPTDYSGAFVGLRVGLMAPG